MENPGKDAETMEQSQNLGRRLAGISARENPQGTPGQGDRALGTALDLLVDERVIAHESPRAEEEVPVIAIVDGCPLRSASGEPDAAHNSSLSQAV